ncbi:4-phosphoerythronate dehydrogenase [Kineobactrum salinum]|uniref:Erythronate-4-phosphate dehydrogenase n=1 Tax=Kineobactrum salinum TaxID=2708301 RepID=A0A6C0TX52_9GAMM|nr:4-phosphoerythronate dehydrogenase [Kineobactrum salinum]QIB64371.1 4-phosphoerythronate dehydrogenase [Kineobactrum salinum]
MPGLRIVADQNIPSAVELFSVWGTVHTAVGRALRPADVADADVLLVRSVTAVNEELLAGSSVRFVGSATAGLDHVDTQYLEAAGISFAAAPGANANAVVEYVLAAIAAVGDSLERLLAGGRAGVVGYGHVGRLLVQRLQALGIASLQYDPWLDAGELPRPAELEAVLDCDVVTLHTSLTYREPWPSHHLLGAAQLSRLTPASLLINAGRGAVIDNHALLACLAGQRAPQCVLDVWETEPWVPPQLLAQVSYGTPHIAGYSHDAKLAATHSLARALAGAFDLALPETATGESGPPLVIPAALEGVDLLRHLLQLRYDLVADDRRLRDTLRGLATAEAGYSFDRLRRDYPVRRELAGSTVVLANSNQAPLARALGCQVELSAPSELPS